VQTISAPACRYSSKTGYLKDFVIYKPDWEEALARMRRDSENRREKFYGLLDGFPPLHNLVASQELDSNSDSHIHAVQ